MLLKLFIVFMLCLMASLAQSCTTATVAQIDVKKMTYKALRQHDCRLNEVNAFCQRGFSNEYEEYERIRQDFLRNTDTSNNQDNVQTFNFETTSSDQ